MTMTKRRRTIGGLKFSSTKQLHWAKMERQMDMITFCDIQDIAQILEFLSIEENGNAKIETHDNKQPFMFGNNDDK